MDTFWSIVIGLAVGLFAADISRGMRNLKRIAAALERQNEVLSANSDEGISMLNQVQPLRAEQEMRHQEYMRRFAERDRLRREQVQ